MKAKYLGVLIGTVCMLSILCSCSGPKTTPDQSVIAHGESTPEARETQEVQEEELQLSEWEQTEWDLAMGSGIVPETLSYQGDITAREFVELIQSMIRSCGGDGAALEQRLKQDYLNQESVIRQDAALALALAAKGIGLNSQISNNHNTCYHEMDDLADESKLFTCINGEVQTIYVDQMDAYELGMLHWGVYYACTQASLESGMNLIVPVEDKFLCSRPISRKDAILAVWRLMTSREKEPDYTTLEAAKAESYDKDIITDELLSWANENSTLPEISNQAVPQYHGACVQNKSSGHLYSSYKEQQIKALSQVGVDCINLWFSFATLGCPGYDISQINKNQLKELDQLIAWCMKYNIHVIIECSRLPEEGGLVNSPRGIADYESYFNPYPMERLYEDSARGEELRGNFTKYWEIIASRYSRLPARYLSFCLLIESEHESEEAYGNTFIPVVKAIRRYNESRVVFCYQSYPNGTYTCMAEIGCPIGYSFYQPLPFAGDGLKNYEDTQQYHLFSLEQLSGYFDDGRTPILFELGGPAKSISLIGNLGEDSNLIIATDNGIRLSSDTNETLSFDIDGASEISMSMSRGCLNFDAIIVELQNGSVATITTSTAEPSVIESPKLTINGDGTWSSSDKLEFEDLYREYLKAPVFDVAKEYHVGMLIMEFGVFGSEQNVNYPAETLECVTFVTNGLRQYGIGYCYHNSDISLDNMPVLLKSQLYHDSDRYTSQFEGRFKRLEGNQNYWYDVWLSDVLYK
ncbi:MAG: hypothetical protein BWY35_02033 [Firmicutes bacterium ADurb.Bin248]|nr:MAG: hypothetical protein BWY35_02033 [Firmicutes bacterium ADurb.Bin248]